MQSLRAAAILFVFLFTSAFVIPTQMFALRFKTLGYRQMPFLYQRFLSRLFGLHVHVIGKPVQGRGVLMVSNHTSYLDILAIGGTAHVSFVAKSEVAGWALFGTFARLQRTVFVDRQHRSRTADTRDEIAARLKQGDALVLFPEGTSDDGNRVLPFKSALMGAAETNVGTDEHVVHVPVQPVSVTYIGVHGLPMGREYRPLYAWYGDMDLVPHLWECLITGPADVVIEFHEPLTVDSVGGRKKLAPLIEEIVRRGQVRALAGLTALPAKAPASALPAGLPQAAE
ncbi:MAG: lysophospholipid acyltransferase family protein [Rhizomicrobium sp.]